MTGQLARFGLVVAAVQALWMLRYLAHAGPISDLTAGLYRGLAVAGQVAWWVGVPVVGAALLGRWLPRRAVGVLAVIAAAAATAMLAADTLVYDRWRFHLDFTLLALFFGSSGDRIFALGPLTRAALVGLPLGLAAVYAGAWRLAARPWPGVRLAWGGLLLALPAHHLLHAWADASYDSGITGLTRHLPLFAPLTARRFLEARGWVDLSEQRELRDPPTGALAYPAATPHCSPPADPLNLLVLVVDTWRADSLRPDETPHAWALAQRPDAAVHRDHWSGGNVTRTGMFSLFYGIPCTAWSAVSAAQIPPVLLSQAAQAGVTLGLGLSADLAPQAFDRTLFSGVEDLLLTRPEETPAGRDAGATADLVAWLEHASEPFSGVLYLDAVHGYSVPDDAPRPFQPAWETPEHLRLGPDTDPTPYRNLYRNALLAADGRVGEVLAALDARGVRDRTIVVLTSDHAEEFNDNGLNHWGHGSNYTAAQLQVPLVVAWPGVEGGDRTWRTTHEDVVATLLQDWLGCEDPGGALSRGLALADPSPRPPLVACSYYNHAIVEPDRATITYPAGPYEIVDPTGRALPDARVRPDTLETALEAMSRYLR